MCSYNSLSKTCNALGQRLRACETPGGVDTKGTDELNMEATKK